MLASDEEDVSWYAEKVASTENNFEGFLIQVGKTYLGKPITLDEYKIIVQTIMDNLDIDQKDHIFDLGCGNGLLTYDIAKHASHVTGFDFNKDLLTVAVKNHQSANITYHQSNIMKIDFKRYNATKFYMYEVIQNIKYKLFRKLLYNIMNVNKHFTLFIAGIPDQTRILNFYHTKERRKFLFEELIENQKIHLGYWWYREHIVQICEDLGLSVKIKEQNPHLSTAHYRFDALICK